MRKENFKNESLLWSSFLSGDDEAYSLIYKQYVQVLFKYGLQFTTNRELIKDCIQDVFEKIHRNRAKLKQTDSIKFYLFVILRNSLFNALKKEQGHSQDIESIEYELVDSDAITDNQLINEEEDFITGEKVKSIFSALTPRQKEVIYYRYIENMDINEIASIMEMNYQSIQNLIQRSIKRIRKEKE